MTIRSSRTCFDLGVLTLGCIRKLIKIPGKDAAALLAHALEVPRSRLTNIEGWADQLPKLLVLGSGKLGSYKLDDDLRPHAAFLKWFMPEYEANGMALQLLRDRKDICT